MSPVKILFLCTGNSCRSQMAEGWARAMHADRIEAHSAGTAPHGLNPLAVRAMPKSGKPAELLKYEGIDAQAIVEAVKMVQS